MKTLEDVVTFAKKLLTKHGSLEPTLLIEGTTGTEVKPLPDAAEAIKLSLLEALGFTLAREERVGDLRQLFLIAEGWRSKAPYHPGLPMTQPKHDPNRVDVLMVSRYQEPIGTKEMVVYDLVRDDTGELTELRALAGPGDQAQLVASPPMEALVRGFRRGRASTKDEPSAA